MNAVLASDDQPFIGLWRKRSSHHRLSQRASRVCRPSVSHRRRRPAAREAGSGPSAVVCRERRTPRDARRRVSLGKRSCDRGRNRTPWLAAQATPSILHQVLNGYLDMPAGKNTRLAFSRAVRAWPRGDRPTHYIALQGNAVLAMEPVNRRKQFEPMRRLESIDDLTRVVKRGPVRGNVRRSQIGADLVLPVVPETYGIEWPCVGHPALALQIAAIQAIQQVSDLLGIWPVAICRKVVCTGLSSPARLIARLRNQASFWSSSIEQSKPRTS